MSKKISIYHQLSAIYNELTKMDENSINEVVEMLKRINFEAVVKYFTEADLNLLDDMDLFTCKKLIEILQFIYNNTDIVSPVSDEVYDQLYQVMLDAGLGDIVGSVNSQGKPVREHQYPDLRGTLNKVHFVFNVDKDGDKRRSIEDWITSVENILGRNINNTEEFEVILQAKWDGCSAVFECDEYGKVEHVLMRGDTEKNQAVDIVELFGDSIRFDKFSKGKKFAVQAEILMNQAEYEKICVEYKEFKSPRSATSSILNEKILQPHLSKYLTIEPLRIQYVGEQPELIPNYDFDMVSNLFNLRDIQECIKQINLHAKEEGRTTDGVVLHLSNKKLQNKLGRNDAINRYEVAYKFPAEAKKAILKYIDFSTGLGGNITPVAKIEPVVMLGKTIKSISLGSVDRYRSMMDRLSEGSEVIIRYEIIPYLELDHTCKVNKDGNICEVPTHCIYCGELLEEDPLLKCVNENCKSRVIGKIVNYINKMRIENINIETVEDFFSVGILDSIESLYSLYKHKDTIVNMTGYGEKSYDKIIEGIDKRQQVFDYELLGSLGIQSIGQKIFKNILSVYDLETLLRLSEEHMLANALIGLSGFGEKTAVRVQQGINSNMKTIRFLLEVLTLKEKVQPGKLKGKVCFSQVRDPKLESELINRGYEVSDSLTKTTNYLIVPSLDVVSSKITKAKKYQIEILTIEQSIKKLL